MNDYIQYFSTVEREKVRHQGIHEIPGRIQEIIDFIESHPIKGADSFKKFLLSLDQEEQTRFDYELAYHFQLQKEVGRAYILTGNKQQGVPYFCLLNQNGILSLGKGLFSQYVKNEMLSPHGVENAWIMTLFMNDSQQICEVSFEEVYIDADEKTLPTQ